MIGGDNPLPIQILNRAIANGVHIREIFRELANRTAAKKLSDVYIRKLVDKWRAAELSPSLLNSKIDAILAVQDSYSNFVKSVLDNGVIRPFNSPPRKLENARDWVDAIETLYGFINYFEQALYSKPITKSELEELEFWCNQWTKTPGLCLAPCDTVKKGFLSQEKSCRVKGITVDIKGKPKKVLITPKANIYRN